jgi:hypothetical protein
MISLSFTDVKLNQAGVNTAIQIERDIIDIQYMCLISIIDDWTTLSSVASSAINCHTKSFIYPLTIITVHSIHDVRICVSYWNPTLPFLSFFGLQIHARSSIRDALQVAGQDSLVMYILFTLIIKFLILTLLWTPRFARLSHFLIFIGGKILPL